jgi:hypothetical protein
VKFTALSNLTVTSLWEEPNDDTVYGRTALGKSELVAPSGHCSSRLLRHLALFTGVTPAGALKKRLGDESEFREAIDELLRKDLIEPVLSVDLPRRR